jgi:hypothetical protein
MKTISFCLCWLLILTAPGVIARQGPARRQSWDLLRQLQPGEKVRLQRKTASKKFTGKFVSASDTELVIESKGKNARFGRDELKNVWQMVPPGGYDKMQAVIEGAGAGSGVGLVIALLIAANTCETGCDDGILYVPFFAALAAGGLIGYFLERDYPILVYSEP